MIERRRIHLRTVPSEYLKMWVGKHLSTTDWSKMTQQDFDRIKAFIRGDGCSGVPDWYDNGCTIHDWGFRTHRDFEGNWVTKHIVNMWMKQYIQMKSWLGRWSPMAAWRYHFLETALSDKAWNTEPEAVEAP